MLDLTGLCCKSDPVLEAIAELIFADQLVDIQELEVLAHHDWFRAYCKSKGLHFEAVKSRLMVAHDDPCVDIEALQKLSFNDQENFLDLLADICVIDDHYDPREIDVIKHLNQVLGRLAFPAEAMLDAAQKRTHHLRQTLKQSSETASQQAKLLWYFDRLLGQDIVNSIAAVAGQSHRVDSWRRSRLFNHEAYAESLKQMQTITNKLLPQTLAVLEKSSVELTKLREEFALINAEQLLGSLPLENRRQLQGLIDNQRKRLDYLVQGKLNQLQNDLQARKRSLHSFCIAIVGRTKAGKSTLLTTLTGRDQAAIGDGSQGFTRYNRAYNFHGIRLIDTPGIGAAGGQGENFEQAEIRDSDVARSIFPESDLVCFVMDNDSTVPCTREIMRDLNNRGKAFVILLNVKVGMQGGLELFRSRVEAFFAKEGERSIVGNIAAIRRDLISCIGAEKANAVQIIPIHAKAAFKANQTKASKEAGQWRKLSQIDCFLEQLDKKISDEAWSLRGETLRKNPRLELGVIVQELKLLEQQLNEQANIFRDTQDGAKKRVAEIFEEQNSAVSEKVEALFTPLELAAARFSSQHFKKNSKELERLWKEEVEKARLDESLEHLLDEIKLNLSERLSELQDDIQERLQFQFETFQLKYKFEFSFDIGFEEFLRKSFNIGFKTLGAILSFAGLFTGGITFLIAGAVALLPDVVNWFLPGAERRCLEAQKALKQQLLKSLKEPKSKLEKHLIKTLNQKNEEITDSITQGLGSSEATLHIFSKSIECCWTNVEKHAQILC